MPFHPLKTYIKNHSLFFIFFTHSPTGKRRWKPIRARIYAWGCEFCQVSIFGNAWTLTSRARGKNKTLCLGTARPPLTRVPPRDCPAFHEMTLSFRLHSLLPTIFSPSRSLHSLSCKPWRGAPPPATGAGGPAHPSAPLVAARPSAGCAGRRHTQPLLKQIRRGCGGGFALTRRQRPFPVSSDQKGPLLARIRPPRRGSGRPRHGSARRARVSCARGWGEGGGSAGSSMAALCPLPPRGVARSLLASPVVAPLPLMGGSLLIVLFI
jgi:hypothetical protein